MKLRNTLFNFTKAPIIGILQLDSKVIKYE